MPAPIAASRHLTLAVEEVKPTAANTDPILGEVDPLAAHALVTDQGPTPDNVIRHDWVAVHRMLSEAGADSHAFIAPRIYAIAQRWLASAMGVGHPAGCQGRQCTAARKIVNTYRRPTDSE